MSSTPKNIVLPEVVVNEPTDQSKTESSPLAGNFDLVGHVEVSIAVKAGHIKTTVDELFSMKKGQVMLMQQLVDEPFSLDVNGKTVAKGALVAVGDHFGVQIVDIVKP